MIVASIDIGTNTVLLLLAQANKELTGISTIKNLYNMPRIGKGLIKGGRISDSKIELLMQILYDYKKEAELLKADYIVVKATNAFRIAANGYDIVEKVKNKLGIKIEIISGEQEAQLSYMGAVEAANTNDNKLVIDIGGGSTEIIVGSMDEILFKKSFQIGVVTLTEKFISSYPPSKENILEINAFVKNSFSELSSFSKERLTAVAVAGTPTTLSCIKQNIKEYSDEKVEGSILSKNDMSKLLNEIGSKDLSQIRNNYGGVVSGREDVLFCGTVILNAILEILNLDEVIVSSKGLRYGAVIDFIKTLNKTS